MSGNRYFRCARCGKYHQIIKPAGSLSSDGIPAIVSFKQAEVGQATEYELCKPCGGAVDEYLRHMRREDDAELRAEGNPDWKPRTREHMAAVPGVADGEGA